AVAPTSARRGETHAAAEPSQRGDDIELSGDRRPSLQATDPLRQGREPLEVDIHAIAGAQDPRRVRDVGEAELPSTQEASLLQHEIQSRECGVEAFARTVVTAPQRVIRPRNLVGPGDQPPTERTF